MIKKMFLIIFCLCMIVATNFVYAGNKEHVHIKLHIPQIVKKHTHYQTVYKHHFHPKKTSYKTVHRLDPEISLPGISGGHSTLPSYETKNVWEPAQVKGKLNFQGHDHDLELEMYKQLWQKEADEEFRSIGKYGKAKKGSGVKLEKLLTDHSYKSPDVYNFDDDHEFMIMDSSNSYKEPKRMKTNFNTYKSPKTAINDDEGNEDYSYSMYAPTFKAAPASDYLKLSDYQGDNQHYNSDWNYDSSTSNKDVISLSNTRDEYVPANWPISSPSGLESLYTTLPKDVDHELTKYDHLDGHYSRAQQDVDTYYPKTLKRYPVTNYPRQPKRNIFKN